MHKVERPTTPKAVQGVLVGAWALCAAIFKFTQNLNIVVLIFNRIKLVCATKPLHKTKRRNSHGSKSNYHQLR